MNTLNYFMHWLKHGKVGKCALISSWQKFVSIVVMETLIKENIVFFELKLLVRSFKSL